MRGQDEEVPGPRFPRTLQAVPEQLRPGFGVPREIGPADRLDEQEIAREREAVVGEQRVAAERVTRHVSGAQRGPSEGDRIPVPQRLIGQPARRLIVGRYRIVGVQEVRHPPTRRCSPRAAQIIRVNVGIDHRRRCRA